MVLTFKDDAEITLHRQLPSLMRTIYPINMHFIDMLTQCVARWLAGWLYVVITISIQMKLDMVRLTQLNAIASSVAIEI